MLRTVGLESNARGRSNSLLLEPAELNASNRVIPSNNAWLSGLITVEGWTHFHLWMTRNPSVRIVPYVQPLWPCFQDGLPASANVFLIADWAAGNNNVGCFYFGREVSFTAGGQVFRFAPLIKLYITNQDPTYDVTVNVALMCND